MEPARNSNGRFPLIGLIMLTTLFGIETIRILLSLLMYVLRDRFSFNAIQIGVIALGLFALSFLAASLSRLIGARRLLAVSAGGVGLLRLAMQWWSGDPVVDLALAFAIIFLFTLFWPALLGLLHQHNGRLFDDVGLGFLAGLAFDVALHGTYHTLDMAWQTDWGTAVLLLLLAGGQWACLRLVGQSLPDQARDLPASQAIAWLAIGPFLFLYLVVLGNVARFTVLIGWSQTAVYAWVLGSQLTGLLAGQLLLTRPNRQVYGLLAVGSGALLVLLLAFNPQHGWAAAVIGLLQTLSAALLLIILVQSLGLGDGRVGLRNLTIGNGLGWLLLAIFTFLFYAGYDIALPFANDILLPAAALVLTLAILGAARAIRADEKSPIAIAWQPTLLLLALLALPLIQWWTVPQLTAVAPHSLPIRAMTYNIHNGFDPMGNLGLEAIAQVIEAQQPDVVALQEVSRGWVINGSADTLLWLANRLEMPYVYGPTAGPLWGNAILSRLPLQEAQLHPLPPDNLLLQRGVIEARYALAGGQSLNVFATHFHHPDDGSAVRLMQAQTVNDVWGERPFSLFMGDLNAEPAAPEIELLSHAGWQDVVALSQISPDATYDALTPSRRIDYIWMSPDLTAVNVVIPTQPASDHLPIATTIENGGQ
ncbi:MAG: endonuclease/exonuclease/phosphatase family protein [Chloroflexi bacterium]|nr:endonuclease/exonuclease/phosphatase family protein [Chloroflexota bacterium]